VADQPLLRSQANQVFATIRAASLDPADFAWETADSVLTENARVQRLVHDATGYYFQFDVNSGRPWTEHWPASEGFVVQQYPGTWDLQLNYCREWLARVRVEAESPDLWSSVVAERALLRSTDDENNSRFTAEELQELSAGIDEIRHFLKATAAIDQEHQRLVADRLDYLKDAADRQGRRDWLHMALGVLVSIIVQVALPADAARELMRHAGVALRSAIGRIDLPE
jgi:hypothetical protein